MIASKKCEDCAPFIVSLRTWIYYAPFESTVFRVLLDPLVMPQQLHTTFDS